MFEYLLLAAFASKMAPSQPPTMHTSRYATMEECQYVAKLAQEDFPKIQYPDVKFHCIKVQSLSK